MLYQCQTHINYLLSLKLLSKTRLITDSDFQLGDLVKKDIKKIKIFLGEKWNFSEK